MLSRNDDGAGPAGVYEPVDEGGAPAGVVDGLFDVPKLNLLLVLRLGVEGVLEEYSKPGILHSFVRIRQKQKLVLIIKLVIQRRKLKLLNLSFVGDLMEIFVSG